MRISLALSSILVATVGLSIVPAQEAAKRPLTHEDSETWPSMRSVTPSADGAWLAYVIGPAEGDAVLEIRSVTGDVVHRHDRGDGPRFTGDGRFVVFKILPSKAEARAARIAKLREAIDKKTGKFEEPKKDDDTDRAQLAILELATGALEVVDRVDTFAVAKDGAFVVYQETPAKAKPAAKPAANAEAGATVTAPPAEPVAGGGRRGGRGGARGGAPAGPTAAAPSAEDAKKGYQPRDGKPLVVRDLAAGTTQRIESVLSFRLVADDRWLVYDVQRAPEKKPARPAADATTEAAKTEPTGTEATTAAPATTEPAGAEAPAAEAAPLDQGLFAFERATGRTVELLDGAAEFGGFVTDKDGRRLAFYSNLDDVAAEQPRVALYLWAFDGGAAHPLVAATAPVLPNGKRIAKSGLGFSRDGSVLTFAVEDDPAAPIAPILPEDKVVLDLWHWKDGTIQPMQSKQRGGDDDRFTCACFVEDGRVVVLGDAALPSMRLITPDGSRALANDSRPYEALVSWDGRYSDVWVVNTIDGTRRKLLTALRGSASASPTGRFVTYFGDDRQWHAIDLTTDEDRALTAGITASFWREDDDTPDPAGAYGLAGWMKDDAAVVVYDRFDLWKIDPRTGASTCVTDGYGRANELTLRYVAIDLEGDESGGAEPGAEEPRGPRGARDDDRAMPERILLSAVDERTKASGYFVDSTTNVERPKKLVMLDAAFGGLQKAKSAERLFFTQSTFADFPDVWTSDLEFGGMRRLTDANPRQAEFRWGHAQLVSWLSADGIELQGKLVVPDDFDPSRQYPMLVYFYEKLSQGLHRYVAPAPGTSPNAAYYVSNGYLWFEPDIVYREGYPGESALKCIVPGVQSLIAKGFVRRDAIGIAGHSWGGYQTAYLITKTDLFAAAESGAPVSNMFSAYGGIRWGTGMSRQFQYEQTQSRIGGTPWQYPLRFLENSPIFFADKVRTPVLILHNDQDGAVPWYQGIEYFMALRRLGKEAYLFDYVGEDHGLRKRQNQRDWTRRMQEFFDHKLKGAPAPRWLVEGIRYEDREREKIELAPSYIEATAPVTAPMPAAEPTGGVSGGVR